MKRILYISFYFEPDLCAGSFRNSPLVKELAKQAGASVQIDLYTTLPNRYSSFNVNAKEFEKLDNITIRRIKTPSHNSGLIDQIKSFRYFYSQVKKEIKGQPYDLVVASSSRLFTAYLGHRAARKLNIPLYLDIRDIFVDTINDVLSNQVLKKVILPILRVIESKTFRDANHINLISPGFKDYFTKWKKPNYSFYTNGIDNIFIDAEKNYTIPEGPYTIVYAGNIGEGQGLHKFIPEAAELLGEDYQFVIIGDGGAKQKLLQSLKEKDLSNVELRIPVSRERLLEEYNKAGFLLMHLNDFEAFKKVLPSKVFELACFPQPLIAGVGGYTNQFVRENINNCILFQPGDVESFVRQINGFDYVKGERKEFIQNFKRKNINKQMANSILGYLK